MDPDQTRKATIGRNGKYLHKIDHCPIDGKVASSMKIRWEFISEDPVKFGLSYKRNDAEKVFADVIKLEKINSHKVKVEGTHDAKESGCYFLIFHNDSYLCETSITYHLSWIIEE